MGKLFWRFCEGIINSIFQKLQDSTGAIDLRSATAEETIDALGASPGSLGAVGVQGLRVLADISLRGRKNMFTGANEDDWHYRGCHSTRISP